MDDTMLKGYQAVVLGALLHDIGKFMQRAELEKIHPEIEKNYDEFCPTGKHGHFVYQHAAHTAYFIEYYIPDGLVDKSKLYDAARHHKNLRGDLFKEADMLSSGIDRDQREAENENWRSSYKQERLYSVFEAVNLAEQNKDGEMHYRYELKAADDDLRLMFPRVKNSLTPIDGATLVPEYQMLWKGFEKEVKNIAAREADAFYAALNCLLLKYTWSIPSSTLDVPDISLYDHAKTTAAIAGCLFLYHMPKYDDKTVRNEEEEKFILLAGDLSGIQNYIFNITHIGAGGSAKRLRARSFTVAMFSEIVTHKFLRTFGLAESHVLMSSGGKFIVLMPKVPGAEQMIREIEREVAQWFYESLNAEIGLNVATLKLAGKDFKKFNEVFSKMNAALQAKKQSPFSALLLSENGWTDKFLLSHATFEEEEKLCKGCGRLPGKDREEGKYFCPFCTQDKKIGQKLPASRQIAFYDEHATGDFKMLGYSFNLCKEGESIKGKPYMVYTLGKSSAVDGVPMSHRYSSYRIPELTSDDCRECDCSEKVDAIPGNPKMFQCIAKKSKGREVLGYLKADVDRLGEIFAFGLKDRTNSVSRIATMSRMLELFFAGYLEQLIKEKYPNIYTVYSGGDDLLLIGPWDTIVDFAVEMRKKFMAFTCNNASITLSAGVILAKPRMPVFRSVEMAERALEEAKELPKEKGRDQVWLFGDYVKWDKFETIMHDAKKLAAWLTDPKVKMSKGFGQNLLNYGKMKKAFDEDGDTRHLRYVPLLSYDMARNLDPPEKDKSGARAWAEGLKEPNSLSMKYMGIVANYALMANRGGQDER